MTPSRHALARLGPAVAASPAICHLQVRRKRRVLEDKPADEMPRPEERRILVREYRKIKKRLAAWDADFERLHGRAPTATERSESKPLQEGSPPCA